MEVIEINGEFFVQATEIKEGEYYRLDRSPKSTIFKAYTGSFTGLALRNIDGETIHLPEKQRQKLVESGCVLLKVENGTPRINNEIEQAILSKIPPSKAISQEVKDAVQAIALLWETNPSVARRIERGLIALAKL